MLKQQREQYQEREQHSYSHLLKEQKTHNPRPQPKLKLIAHSMQENRQSITNRHKIDNSSNTKANENQSKGSAIKGIQVTSSRQSSSQKQSQVTGRSCQRQKQSRQIKSQTNISQFPSPNQSLVQKQTATKIQMQDVYLFYENKLSEAMMKSNALYHFEVTQLKQVISDNQQRINNLIDALNLIIERNGQKQKAINKLEQKIESLTQYHQQCSQYTQTRCHNIQIIHRVLTEELEKSTLNTEQIKHRLHSIESIIKHIFFTEKYRQKQMLQTAHRQIGRLNGMTNNIQEQLYSLQSMKIARENYSVKQLALGEYLLSIKNMIATQKSSFDSKSPPHQNTQHIDKLVMAIETLSKKVFDCEEQRSWLQRQYQQRQETVQQTIWELSNLLNKQQRQIQEKKQQIDQYVKYNKQIENNFITAKLKENSLRISIQTHFKDLETSKDNEYDQLQKQKDIFKEKFQESFRHNQQLQNSNYKNHFTILQMESQIKNLSNKVQLQQKELHQFQKFKCEVAIKEQYWSNRLRLQTLTIEGQMHKKKEEIHQQQSLLNENARQILLLETQIKQLQESSLEAKSQYSKLYNEFLGIRKQYEQEQLYSEHLEKENQQMSKALQEYKSIFESQSEMFKSTIDQLKVQNKQLHKHLYLQAQDIFACQPKKYQESRPTSTLSFSKEQIMQ